MIGNSADNVPLNVNILWSQHMTKRDQGHDQKEVSKNLTKEQYVIKSAFYTQKKLGHIKIRSSERVQKYQFIFQHVTTWTLGHGEYINIILGCHNTPPIYLFCSAWPVKSIGIPMGNHDETLVHSKTLTGFKIPVSSDTSYANPSSPTSGINFPLHGLQTTPPKNRNVVECFPRINITADTPLNSSDFDQGVLKAPAFIPNGPAYPTGFKRSQRALIKFDKHSHVLPIGDIRPSALPVRGGRNICRATTQRFFRESLDVNSSISHDISMLAQWKTGFYICPSMCKPISPERIPFPSIPPPCRESVVRMDSSSTIKNSEQGEHHERIYKQTQHCQTQGSRTT
jgi:hypothetical protein